MKKVKFSVGIDISSSFFTVTILSFNFDFISEGEFFSNNDGFDKFADFLKKYKATKSNSHLIMEATGVYTEELCLYLHNKGYQFSVASPLKVKKAFGNKVNIDDWIASKKIAEYGIRYSDELVLWQPPDNILEQVKILLSLREQMVRESTVFKNRTHALKKKVIQSQTVIDITVELINKLNASIKEVENEIRTLIKSETHLGSLFLRLISVPGVGLLLATELMVLTQGFTKTLDSKEIAAYLGICPHSKQSGTSINRKAKSTGIGPSRLRKLIYLAALSLRIHNPMFKEYFLRKQLAGKKPKLILNNIANKLLKIICGVIKSGKSYFKDYRPLPPALAA